MRHFALALASLALPTFAVAQTAAPAGPSPVELAEARELAPPAVADALSVTGTLTFATGYVSDGVEYSDGGVVQPYLELRYAGFYVGIWATNAADDLLGADSEMDYYIGYRGEAGTFSYDVGYGYYAYPGASGLNSGEVLRTAGAGLNDTLFLAVGLAYSTEFETLDSTLLVDCFTPLDGLSVAATHGYSDAWNDWTAGASYALNETVSVDLTWNDATLEEADGVLVAGLSFDFNIR